MYGRVMPMDTHKTAAMTPDQFTHFQSWLERKKGPAVTQLPYNPQPQAMYWEEATRRAVALARGAIMERKLIPLSDDRS